VLRAGKGTRTEPDGHERHQFGIPPSLLTATQ
jgi:hypothetical protein